GPKLPTPFLGHVAAQGTNEEGRGARREPSNQSTLTPTPAHPSLAAPSTGQDSPPPATLSLDAMKLPAQAILVVCEEMKQALGLIPRAVVLTPDEYQRLLDRIEQLERRLAPDRPIAPSICRLSGRVEERLARLQAHFQFRTERPNARVNLA